jgi:hypothetical protein
MHIEAAMAALDVWDLDRNAKHALLVVCCRADYPSGYAEVPVNRIAADMKVHYETASTALARAVQAGYLSVAKSVGKTPIWRPNLAETSRRPRGDLAVQNRDHLAVQNRELRIKKEEELAPPLRSTKPPSGGAGEKPAAPRPRTTVDAKGYLYVVEGE